MRTCFCAVLALLAFAAAPACAQSPAPLTVPDLQLHSNGSVFASATIAGGGFIVGGNFTSFNSVHRASLAKFHADGTLDPTWAASVDGTVNSIAVDGSNGDIFIGGAFSEVNGVTRGNLAKLHADGSLDLAWDAPVDIGFSFSGSGVFALALDGAGDLFLGGTMTGGLAKVSTSGAGVFDPSWSLSFDGTVYALAFDGTSLFVGGNFTSVNPGNIPRNFLAKVSPAGAVDASWTPQPDANTNYSDPTVDVVYAMVLDGSGNLYVGGAFTSMGGDPGPPAPDPCPGSCPGHYYAGLAKLSTSGSGAPDPTWRAIGGLSSGVAATCLLLDGAGHLYVGGPSAYRVSTSGAGTADSWHPTIDSTINTLAPAQFGGVYAGGAFLNVGGARHFGFAGIDSSGTVSASTPDAEVVGQVYALAPLADGSMIVGGSFLKSGQQARNNILKVQANGTLDSTWNPAADQTVLSLAADGAGNVYVGGTFANIGGKARASVAKVSATGTGAANATWNPSVAPAGHPVNALALDGSHVYLGGDFTQVGAQTYNGGLARVSTSAAGAVDTGWIPFATDPINDGGTVKSLVLDGGYLYAGGIFFDEGGLQYVARYSTAGSGSADASWNPAPNFAFFGNNQVDSLYADGAGSLFIGGIFQSIGPLERNNIAKVSTSGAGDADADWDPSADEQVFALLPDGNGNLYVGGGFFNIGGHARRCIAKVSATGTGTADAKWNSSADDVVRVLALGGVNGDIYAGGDFVATGTEERYGLAAFGTDVLFSNGFGSPLGP